MLVRVAVAAEGSQVKRAIRSAVFFFLNVMATQLINRQALMTILAGIVVALENVEAERFPIGGDDSELPTVPETEFAEVCHLAAAVRAGPAFLRRTPWLLFRNDVVFTARQ